MPDLFSKKHLTLHSNNSSSCANSNNNNSHNNSGSKPKGRSFLGISLGRNDSTDSTRSDHSTHSADNSNNHSYSTTSPSINEEEDHHHSSMHELKRFFRPSIRKHSQSQTSLNPTASNNSTRTTHHHPAQGSFANGHGISSTSKASNASSVSLSTAGASGSDEYSSLVQKYGKLGKILGSGAGGSVRLLTRPSDGVTFAVKEFRPRKPGEQLKDYAKKCTAEFCIGSTLHHPNIIKTLDIIDHDNQYFEIMEYCPVDFFAVVMSGKMTRSEINCCLRQMTEGLKYLHEMGLAHRDLKLDNCVMTRDGILKLIDFGSAVVFRYPFEDTTVKAHGVVGSDPYLAPEVLTLKEYDPQPVDVWSIAIIYCCMTLKRFPWKAPKQSDPSFKLYSMPDDEPHDYVKSAEQHKILIQKRREERLRRENGDPPLQHDQEHHDQEHHDCSSISVDQTAKKLNNLSVADNNDDNHGTNANDDAHTTANNTDNTNEKNNEPAKADNHRADHDKPEKKPDHDKPKSKHKSIHGPYRLMRLLPHASRPIISRMLEIDPEKRATLKDVFEDPWFSSIVPCTINKDGSVFHAPGHTHTIVDGEAN